MNVSPNAIHTWVEDKVSENSQPVFSKGYQHSRQIEKRKGKMEESNLYPISILNLSVVLGTLESVIRPTTIELTAYLTYKD